MILTVKNVANVLLKEYTECPNCGGELSICSVPNAEETQSTVVIYCPGCGTSADLRDALRLAEERGLDR